MKDFISDIELDGERWHPGASILNDFADQRTWQFKENYSKNMDNSTSEIQANKMMKADLSYLRSGDGNFAIGVLTNKTYNFASTSNCEVISGDNVNWYNSEQDERYTFLENTQIVNCKDENLKLKGLNNGKYYINYFLPGNYSVPVHSSDDKGPKVKLSDTLYNSLTEYIIPFKARKKGFSWLELNQNEETFSNDYLTSIENDEKQIEVQKTVIYPNPFLDKLTIVLSENLELNKFEILSIDGRIIETGSFSTSKFEINTNCLQKGNYLLKLSNKTEFFTFKVIKL